MGSAKIPTALRKGLAERLKSARIMRGYETQENFALALGVERERYKKWESGRTPIPPQFIQRICQLLAVDANYLYQTPAIPTKPELTHQKAG